jgi:NodT family efflux transporter outer membrane factor (OMF) lipoprotein
MPTRRSRPLVLLACLSLAGCITVGPEYEPPAPDVPAGWTRLEPASSPTLEATATGDLGEWWQRLGDPLLSELVAEAVRSAPDVRSARARLREARARRVIAAADFYPGVGASATARTSQSSEQAGSGETRELYAAGFDASWEVDVFGGTRRGVEAADADVEFAAASLADTQVTLAAEVAGNYVEVRAQQALIRIARINLDSQSETLQITEWREQAGLASIQDVEQARTNRERTRAVIPSLETSLAAAEHRLDILLGLAPGTLHPRLAADENTLEVPDGLAVGIPADTLRQRPDVRAAERRLAAETARVGVAEAARYPSFTISGSVGVEALTVGALDASGAGTSSLLGGITAPIFEAGRLRNQVLVQDAVREQAEVSYEQAVLTALADVENALVDLVRNRERDAALTRAVESARLASTLAQSRYNAGLIDFQSVLETDRTVLAVEESLARTRADGALAIIGLYKSLGGGWSPSSASGAAGKDTP